MFDYSAQLEAFRDKRVRLSSDFKEKLLSHRSANRSRLIARLSDHLKGTRIGDANFKPQGSVAMGTVIQTKFVDQEYDIDDGLVIARSQMSDDDGDDVSAATARNAVKEALKDNRFKRQPKLFTNCVRVFYAEEDEEKHHVDFPVYRRWSTEEGVEVRELASEDGWIESDPTQVNSWFNGIVEDRNAEANGWGTQFRHLVQLLKRFCRSRKEWLELLPNGMKLTMLVAESQPQVDQRIDSAFRELLENLKVRLESSKIIRNLAHPDRPMITRTAHDSNVEELLRKIGDALDEVRALDSEDNNSLATARTVWDRVFRSDGFFKEYDEAREIQESTIVTASKSPFDVPWRELPLWPLEVTFSASIVGSYGDSEHGSVWYPFGSNSAPLKKHLHLRFNGSTDTPRPYQVYWQVVNTGLDAIQAGCKRGKIIASKSVGAGGLQGSTAPAAFETTLYTGMHWVELFIVKDGVCVARSGPFIVNIA